MTFVTLYKTFHMNPYETVLHWNIKHTTGGFPYEVPHGFRGKRFPIPRHVGHGHHPKRTCQFSNTKQSKKDLIFGFPPPWGDSGVSSFPTVVSKVNQLGGIYTVTMIYRGPRPSPAPFFSSHVHGEKWKTSRGKDAENSGCNFLLKAAGLINPDGVAAKIKISKSEATVTPRSTYRVKHVAEGNSGTVTW